MEWEYEINVHISLKTGVITFKIITKFYKQIQVVTYICNSTKKPYFLTTTATIALTKQNKILSDANTMCQKKRKKKKKGRVFKRVV